MVEKLLALQKIQIRFISATSGSLQITLTPVLRDLCPIALLYRYLQTHNKHTYMQAHEYAQIINKSFL